jgi:hypothetical protein
MFKWLKGKKGSANGTDYFRLQPVMEGLLQSHGLKTSTYNEWTLVLLNQKAGERITG